MKKNTKQLLSVENDKTSKLRRVIATSSAVTALAAVGTAYYIYRYRKQEIALSIPCNEEIHKIDIGGSIDLVLKFGGTTAITLYASRAHFSRASVQINNHCLSAFVIGGKRRSIPHQIRLEVTLPHLKGLTAYGSSTVTASGINRVNRFFVEQFNHSLTGLEVETEFAEISICGNCTSNLFVQAQTTNINLVGSAQSKLQVKTTKSLNVDLEGGANLYLAGQATELSIHGGGSSVLEAGDLLAQNARILLEEGASAYINVTKSIRTELSGSSLLTLDRKPEKVIQEIIQDGATLRYTKNILV